MLRNTPASYKKEYPWLKEVDSLALANVQIHLESAFHKFFREPSAGFPRFTFKNSSRMVRLIAKLPQSVRRIVTRSRDPFCLKVLKRNN